jgi:mannosyl-oligosaccharide alpha-1,2-mannosidase
MWLQARPQIRDQMLFQPMAPDNDKLLLPGVLTGILADKNGGKVLTLNLEGKSEHLTCFLGGTFALSAKLYNHPADLDVAAKLTNGCVWAYTSTRTGIAPDTFSTLSCKNAPFNCTWDEKIFTEAQRYKQPHDNVPKGFLEIERSDYTLRPEAIESVFMMWRTTGDSKWRDIGWDMFEAIRKHTRTRYGHAGLRDVMDASGEKIDKMESFWLSETLKYFYLLFAEPSLVSLDEWVFNTEAHPFRLMDETRGHG